jgi:hypothetical protein
MGCKFNTCEIRYVAGKPIEATWGVLGSDGDTPASTETPTFPAHTPILASYGLIEIDDTDRCAMVRNVNLTFNNLLEEDSYTICDNVIVEPDRQGPTQISGTMETWVDQAILTALHDKFRAGTSFKLELIHNGPIITGAIQYLFQIVVPYNIITPSGDPKIADGGVVKQTWAFEGYKGNAEETFQVDIWNSDQAWAP